MARAARLQDDTSLLDDMRLPKGEELEYLLDGLGNLIRRRGLEPLLSNPILLPESRYFPDRAGSGPVAARSLLRRLMSYAGLDYRVRLYVYQRFVPRQLGTAFIVPASAHTGAAAWYAGHEAGEAHFGVDRRELRNVDELIGTLGHEVAHLYRDHHRLVVSDHEVEELLTDLTTIYLGFGVFLLQSSFSFKTGGYDEQGNPLSYERQVRGYLRLGELATLLAAQLVLRNAKGAEQRRILAALPANQSSLVKSAFKQLAARREWLLEHLELTEEQLRPLLVIPEPSIENIPEEKDEDYIQEAWEDGEPLTSAAEQPRGPSESLSRAPKPLRASFTLPIVLAAVGACAGAYFGPIPGVVSGGAALACGMWFRGREARFVCSSCGGEVFPDKDWCPGCDGPVSW